MLNLDMNKEAVKLIRDNRREVLERWHSHVLSFFPGKMQSATPIAQALDDGLGNILDSFGTTPETLGNALAGVVRILAVQNFPPSRAMSLFFELKSILQKIAPGTSYKRQIKQKDWDEFQTGMEHLTLEAFDSYMAHREKIYQLKVEESKRQTFMMQRGEKA